VSAEPIFVAEERELFDVGASADELVAYYGSAAYLEDVDADFAADDPPLVRHDPAAGEWLIRASELLAEPDPGPLPYLVDGLIPERELVACVGRWKTTKSYAKLEIAVSIVTGEPAFGALPIPNPGPVIYICEESGKAALWRRLDALCRGRAIDRDRLDSLFIAANRRVKLDDLGWQRELIAMGQHLRPRMFGFDPLVRMKAAGRDENPQKDMAPVIEFLRELRDETDAGVSFVHHTGHQGDHMRGTSDLESVWETKLIWKRENGSSEIEISSEHREAESNPPIRYRITWDAETRTIRFPLVEGALKAKVRAYLTKHPEASGNEVVGELKTNRQQTLDAVREIREEGGSEPWNHPGTTPAGASERSGSDATPYSFAIGGSGTASASPHPVPVPEPRTTDGETR
jgi:AAA domain